MVSNVSRYTFDLYPRCQLHTEYVKDHIENRRDQVWQSRETPQTQSQSQSRADEGSPVDLIQLPPHCMAIYSTIVHSPQKPVKLHDIPDEYCVTNKLKEITCLIAACRGIALDCDVANPNLTNSTNAVKLDDLITRLKLFHGDFSFLLQRDFSANNASNQLQGQFIPYNGHSRVSRKRKATDNASITITRNNIQDEINTSMQFTSGLTSDEYVELINETCGHGYADDHTHYSDQISQYSEVRSSYSLEICDGNSRVMNLSCK
jgi:hypothetical protein